MPDTKSGREKKGKNKRSQLEHRLVRQELSAAEEPPDPEPEFEGTETEFLADPQELDD